MEKKKKRLLKLIVKNLTVIAMFVIVFTVFVGFHVMKGDNMHPAIESDDLVVVFKLENPQRGDVVMYHADGTTKVGRLIAVAGDEVDISEEGLLYINSNLASEEIFYPTEKANKGSVTYPVILGENECFILNDYRPDAADSRTFGPVSASDIEGSAMFVFRNCRKSMHFIPQKKEG